jgi:hypothetical protein
VLDYSGADGERVRISFAFSPDGKVLQTRCRFAMAI